MHETFLYKESLILQKNAYLLKTKRSSEFSLLFTHLLVFDIKKHIKILQLTKVKSHLNGCWEGSFLCALQIEQTQVWSNGLKLLLDHTQKPCSGDYVNQNIELKYFWNLTFRI